MPTPLIPRLPNRSIVFGGTGLVGAHIVRRLVSAGERPLAVSRGRIATEDIDGLVYDLEAPSRLELPACENLYCTANVQLLAQALPLFEAPVLKRVVAFTTTSIVTKIDGENLAERESARQLVEGERLLIETCRRLGIEWTILRPTLIYDEYHDINVTRLARLIERYGVFPLAGRGGGLRQPVHAEDLAIGAVAVAASPAAANKVYVVAGDDVITYREMVGRIFDGLGKPRRIVSIPLWLWRWAFVALKRSFPNANTAMGARMGRDMSFDISEARADFAWNPRGFRPKFDRKF
jgi:nucleoside-diphosphate-sugar epimerase